VRVHVRWCVCGGACAVVRVRWCGGACVRWCVRAVVRVQWCVCGGACAVVRVRWCVRAVRDYMFRRLSSL
jgi:hypothetical protein